MSLKFWTQLRDYAERRMNDYHSCSIRCPHCNRWSYAVGGVKEQRYDKTGRLMICCNQCECWSLWLPAPAPISLGVMADPGPVEEGK